jgi:multidrug efflux pump subunit AcrA (membrane-fusion protein)
VDEPEPPSQPGPPENFSMAQRESDRPRLVYSSIGRAALPLRHTAVRAIGRALGALIVVAAIVLSTFVTRLYYVYPRTDDAYVRANVVGIAAHVSDPIVKMPIVDTQHVREGQLLFIVDPRLYKSAVDRAVGEFLFDRAPNQSV